MREREKEDVIIDVCPNCKGVWLDHGELEKLVEIESERAGKYRRYYEDDDDRPAPGQQQPQMQAALQKLRASRRHLEKATADKGGHRNKAMDLVSQAIRDIRAEQETHRTLAIRQVRPTRVESGCAPVDDTADMAVMPKHVARVEVPVREDVL